MLLQFAPLLCYIFYYFVQWKKKVKAYNKTKSWKPFWNVEFWEPCRWIYSQQNYPRNVQLSKQKWNKYDNYIYHRTWQILTTIVLHSKHDVQKFIEDYNMYWILRPTLWYYTKKLQTYTHTHTHTHTRAYIQRNIYTVKSSTNVTTINMYNIN